MNLVMPGGTGLAPKKGMDKKPKILKCYISSFNNSQIDPYLNNLGFTTGLVGFAIPDFGILFRCRAKGECLDLEFGSLFALLGFIKTKLKDQKIKEVQVMSSNPYFVFSFSGNKDIINKNKERKKLLQNFRKKYSITVAYIRPEENKGLLSSSDYASMPVHYKVPLKPDLSDSRKIKIMPFNPGIIL